MTKRLVSIASPAGTGGFAFESLKLPAVKPYFHSKVDVNTGGRKMSVLKLQSSLRGRLREPAGLLLNSALLFSAFTPCALQDVCSFY